MSTIFSKFSKSFQIQTESLHWPWGSPQSCPHDVAELIAYHSPLFIWFWQNWPLFSFLNMPGMPLPQNLAEAITSSLNFLPSDSYTDHPIKSSHCLLKCHFLSKAHLNHPFKHSTYKPAFHILLSEHFTPFNVL